MSYFVISVIGVAFILILMAVVVFRIIGVLIRTAYNEERDSERRERVREKQRIKASLQHQEQRRRRQRRRR